MFGLGKSSRSKGRASRHSTFETPVIIRLEIWFENNPGKQVILLGNVKQPHIGHDLSPGWGIYSVPVVSVPAVPVPVVSVASDPLKSMSEADEWMAYQYKFKLMSFLPIE